MNLVSQNFIFVMIITAILYYISPKNFKKYILLLISFAFLTCLGLENIAYILIATVITYLAGLCLEKIKYKKLIVFFTVFFNCIILIFIKLIPYLIIINEQFNILVPLGISYYTFQLISYIIDVFREKYKAENNFFNFALYSMYFPYLFVGPINRFNEVKESLIEGNKKLNKNDLYYGILRIAFGFFKKLVIVSRIQIIISTITSDTQIYVGGYALLAMLLYSIEIFADFSGAIDIVIGFSKILQIKLAENFDMPYLADSVDNFWKRWHISLTSWFRDYLYIPLGGNRKGNLKKYINILIVFTVSGLWHGINYILWGILHGICVSIDKILNITKRNKYISIPFTYLIVSMLWSFFIWQDTFISLKMILSVFTKFNYLEVFNNILNLGLNIKNIIVLIISIIILIIIAFRKNILKEFLDKKNFYFKTTILSIFIMFIIIFGIYGIGFNVSEFIYNKF